MRDGIREDLGQRVGVGIWLAIGAVLALLAVQTALVTAESTIVTDLGAPPAAAAAVAAPALPVATPNVLVCTGSDCPTTKSTVVTSPTIAGVTPVALPPAGMALECPDVGISGSLEITDAVEACSAEIEALKATCTFNVATLGYGIESVNFATDAPVEREDSVSIGATAAEVRTMNGTVLEQYDCPGGTLTTRRGVYQD